MISEHNYMPNVPVENELIFWASFSRLSFIFGKQVYYISSLVKIISLGKPKNLSQFCHVLNWLYQSKTAGKHEEPRVKMISLKNRATQNDWISGASNLSNLAKLIGSILQEQKKETQSFRPKQKPLGYIQSSLSILQRG